MKRVMLMVIALVMMFSFGCASKDYVKQQIDPLVDRISKLEANCCKAQPAAMDPAYLKRAEDAAKRAEAAAAKCQKAFELDQKK